MLQGKSVFSRIRNARNSLDNAERSFSSHQEIRGELDLMLAEAELQKLRQKRGGRIGWTRHTFAACAAVLLLAAGGLGWWWASAYGEHTSQAASSAPGPVAVSEKKESVQTAETIKTNGVQVKANVAPEAALSGVPAPPAEETARPAPHAVVPDASMPIQVSAGQLRQLIRSGKQELSSIR